jgi:hypothetical protein
MMRTVTVFILLVLPVVASSGCSDPTLEVRTFWSPGVDAAKIGSVYDWSPDNQDLHAKASPDAARVAERLKATLAEHFAARGYRQANNEKPDLWVSYYVGSKTIGPGTAAVNFVNRGQLVVDLLDPERGDRLWRGTAQADVDTQDTPEARDKRIQEAVQRMIADLPDHARKQ